jgi:PEP-CTERM motif
MRLTCRFATLSILAAAALPSHADTIYSTFEPGHTFNSMAYVTGTIEVGDESVNQLIAAPFIPTETATLSDAVLAMRKIAGKGDGPVTVFIESSSAGAPDAILDTLTQVGGLTTTPLPVDFTCSSCSVLDAGTMYFLVAFQPDPSSQSGWNLALSTTGTIYSNNNGRLTGAWNQDPNSPLAAFEVNGDPAATPEPSTLVLLGTGVLGLAGMVRRKLSR